jgi:predicted signal transduction protein with EAL and GGDEF domain
VATLTVVAIMATAALVGWRWAVSVDDQAHRNFESQASAIASAVEQSLRSDEDLTAMARTMIELEPRLTNRGLQQWFTDMGAAQRFQSAMGISYTELVSASQLSAYKAAVAADPMTGALGSFTIAPAGARAPFCFTRLLTLQLGDSQLSGDAVIPPGIDWCATPNAWAYQASRDTGQFVVTPVLMPDELQLLGLKVTGSGSSKLEAAVIMALMDRLFAKAVYIYAPVYGGATPSTVAGRRATLVGWVSGMFDTSRILSSAANDSRGLALDLLYKNPGRPYQVFASLGNLHRGSVLRQEVPFTTDGQWEVAVSEPSASSWQSGLAQGVVVGAVLVLIGMLVLVVALTLSRSRRRAWALVDERTRQLRHQALHDALTGLPNRALIMDRANQMLARGRRNNVATTSLFVDLDNFKDINDSLGHAAGDQLLVELAQRLSSVVRDTDTVGRLGGDEFVVLTEGAPETLEPDAGGGTAPLALPDGGATVVAERILDVLREPFLLGRHGSMYAVSASIGVAAGPRDSAEDLLRDADIALREAKAAGKRRYVVFQPQMQQAVENHLELQADLRSAVERDEFFLVFQPIFEIGTEVVVGAEALLRWQHPVRGVVMPDDFVPQLEESGLIIPVGAQVVRRACQQAADLCEAGYDLWMSVNVSPRQLGSPALLGDITKALESSGLDPHKLVVEVTEGTLMGDPASTAERMSRLKALGVRVAIDDFGTGYSSFAHLRRFPVDILKIDRSFIASMTTSQRSSALVHTLVQLGRSLGLNTVAEGIEEQQQLDQLREERCDTGQGFLYARPLAPADLEAFLGTHGFMAAGAGSELTSS